MSFDGFDFIKHELKGFMLSENALSLLSVCFGSCIDWIGSLEAQCNMAQKTVLNTCNLYLLN